MKRPTYRGAVAWVALNDNAGARGAFDLDEVRNYLTVGFVADLFGKEQEAVAQDVIDYRAERMPALSHFHKETA